MTHLLLSHLSKENNHPDLALSVFKPHAGNVNIAVAPRHDVSELYCIAHAEEKKCITVQSLCKWVYFPDRVFIFTLKIFHGIPFIAAMFNRPGKTKNAH